MVELLQGRAIIRVIHPDSTEPEAPPALLAIDKYRVVAVLFSPLPGSHAVGGHGTFQAIWADYVWILDEKRDSPSRVVKQIAAANGAWKIVASSPPSVNLQIVGASRPALEFTRWDVIFHHSGQHGTGGCPGPFRSLLPPPAMAGPPGRSIPLSRRRTLGGWWRSRRWLRDFRDIPGNAPGLPVQDGHPLSGLFPRPAATVSGVQPAVGAVADSGFAQICAILHLPRKRDLRLSDQIWGNPNETRAAAHSASTVHPIHDVQPDHWRADTSPGPSPFLAFRGPVPRIPMPADPAGDKI